VCAQPDVATPAGLRDQALLETRYSTGMRRGEVIHLSLPALMSDGACSPSARGRGAETAWCPSGSGPWPGSPATWRSPPSVGPHTRSGHGVPHHPGAPSQPEPPQRPSARLRGGRRGRPARGQSPPSPHHGYGDAGGRGGHPLHPADAGARQTHDDSALHACRHPAASGGARRHAPAARLPGDREVSRSANGRPPGTAPGRAGYRLEASRRKPRRACRVPGIARGGDGFGARHGDSRRTARVACGCKRQGGVGRPRIRRGCTRSIGPAEVSTGTARYSSAPISLKNTTCYADPSEGTHQDLSITGGRVLGALTFFNEQWVYAKIA